MLVDEVFEVVQKVKDGGVICFCMGVVWCELKVCDEDVICDMIFGVKVMGMEICVMLGMLEDDQVKKLCEVGLDYYNYNIDIVLEDYGWVILMCIYQDCLDMLECVCGVGIYVCMGGIIGMGELEMVCIGLIVELVNMDLYLESVLINYLVVVENILLGDSKLLDVIEFVCIIVMVWIMMLKFMVCLLVGCEGMSCEIQVLCFLVGVNFIFVGEEFLIMLNLEKYEDFDLFKMLGIELMIMLVE